MVLRSLACLGLLFCSACPAADVESSASAAPATSAAAPGASSAASSTISPPASMTREAADRAARDVLGAWLRAQNEDKLEDYLKVYDPSFTGIRRTPSGVEKKLTLSEWAADRKALFDKAQRVAADALELETWHDGKLPAGEIELKFTQRWQSGPNADHGPKRVRMRADAASGLRIVSEEMVSSSKGWEDDAKVKTKEVDGSALRAPIKVSLVSEKGLWGHRWVLRLRDAGGTVKHTTIDQTECVNETSKPSPANQGNVLFEVDQPSCSGEHKQKVRVVTDGSGVAVKGYFIEDLHTPDSEHWESGWLDLARVRLATGAKVVAE